MPTAYGEDILGYERALYRETSHEPQHARARSFVYPPIGFFPFYEIGNGDAHGFYWPIGREHDAPLVAFTSHDVWSLIPEHSQVESLYCCQLARSDEETSTLSSYRELAKLATGREPAGHPTRRLLPDSFKELLGIDPESPFYLCAVGDIAALESDFEVAVEHYCKSLARLPEYTAAHFGLAYVLRRLGRQKDASIHLRSALIEPIVFYGGSFWAETLLPGQFRSDWQRKSLMWLQQLRVYHETLAGDPFLLSVHELTFKRGLATNNDIDVLKNVVAQYAAKRDYRSAARLWRLVGELAAQETTSFRERYQLTPLVFGNRLADFYHLAGNQLRAELILNMMESLDKPNGLYL